MDFTTWVKVCKPDERKLRLFACACARSVWPLLTDKRSRRTVEAAEKLETLPWQTLPCTGGSSWRGIDIAIVCRLDIEQLQIQLDEWLVNTPSCPQTAFVSCIAGPCARKCGRCVGQGGYPKPIYCHDCKGFGFVERPLPTPCHKHEVFTCSNCEVILAANDNRVRNLARHIYAKLDFGLMPMLADALEDYGCRSVEMLEHLRADGGEQVQSSISCNICPKCGKSGRWRHGVNFEHEKICSNEAAHDDGRWFSWDPGEKVGIKIRLPAIHARGCHVLDLILGNYCSNSTQVPY